MAMSPEEKKAFDKLSELVTDLAKELDDERSKLYNFTLGLQNNSSYFLFNSSNPNFRLRLPSLSADPSTGEEGAVCVVGGKVKVYTSGAWVVVGTQT